MSITPHHYVSRNPLP